MFLREVRIGKSVTYAKEVKPGVWEECGHGVFRDNIHRILKIKRKKVKGAWITIYEIVGQ